MSEQIQSLLSQIENKFDQSFSQNNSEKPVDSSPNPESAIKAQLEIQYKKIQGRNQEVDFDQMKDLLLQQMNRQQTPEQQFHQKELQTSLEIQSNSNQNNSIQQVVHKKQNTPNFKSKDTHNQEYYQNLRKVTSSQNFCKTSHQTFQPGEQNPFYYKELTIKLQKALMKISSDKLVGPSKKSFNFYDRVDQFEQKKKRQIQCKKQQLEEKQINSVQDRPLINSYSRAIVAQISNDPIHIRADRILQKRKEKEEEYKRIKKQRQEKQYEQFKVEFQSYMGVVKQKYEAKGVRSIEDYYNQQQIWIKTKEKKIQSKQALQNQKIKNEVTFKPLINSKSQKIIQNSKDQKRVPIFDRQPKKKQQTQDPHCTFKPKINKNNFYKKTTYYQAPF